MGSPPVQGRQAGPAVAGLHGDDDVAAGLVVRADVYQMGEQHRYVDEEVVVCKEILDHRIILLYSAISDLFVSYDSLRLSCC